MDPLSLPPKLSRDYVQSFERWFVAELQEWRPPNGNGQEQVWRTIEAYLKRQGGVFADLTASQLAQLKSAFFKLGIQTSHLAGVEVPPDLDRRLKGWGWSQREIRDFRGWAYRVAVIKAVIESGEVQDFQGLVRATQSHPLLEAERQAIEVARTIGLENLQPVYNATGNVIQGEALQEEKQRLKQLLVEALIQSEHPLKLAREMYKVEKPYGIFRDFERVARTEMANCFSHGSFRADRISGKFADNDMVYRISRPQACKLCISLYTSPEGTPRLYRVRDLSAATTAFIRIPGKGRKLYRAVIGITHENCLCSPWQKFWGEAQRPLFKESAPQYLEARKRYQLDLSWWDRIKRHWSI